MRDVKLFGKPGTTLLSALRLGHEPVSSPCGGAGTCGKCRVRVVSGNVSEMDEDERRILSPTKRGSDAGAATIDAPVDAVDAGVCAATGSAAESDVRLACLAEFADEGPVTVRLADSGLAGSSRDAQVLVSGHVPDFKMDAALDASAGEGSDADEAANQGGLGVAIDIGTTTVVLSLVDLSTGEQLATAAGVNAQVPFGMDVLTRITYEVSHPGTGAAELQRAIVGQLDELLRQACDEAGCQPGWVSNVVVAANCTMVHMLLGIDARPLGKAPYSPQFQGAQSVPACSIGWESLGEATVRCLPHVSAYIGADIVAGVWASGLAEADQVVMFIDIGTNGEIVLSDRGKLLSCACAAGPALEGMNISCGMRAAAGAVEDVAIAEDGTVSLQVIGGGSKGAAADAFDGVAEGEGENLAPEDFVLVGLAPAGLCGSGILAAVSELVRTGCVASSGAFKKLDALPEGDPRLRVLRLNGTKREAVLYFSSGPDAGVVSDLESRAGADSGIDARADLVVTQGDIRQVQLAKGAILSGFKALLSQAGLSLADVDQVVVAGQFGAHLSAKSLVGCGIVPPELEHRIRYIGNSSHAGAYAALLSSEVRDKLDWLADRIDYFELAEFPGYERLFAECTRF